MIFVENFVIVFTVIASDCACKATSLLPFNDTSHLFSSAIICHRYVILAFCCILLSIPLFNSIAVLQILVSRLKQFCEYYSSYATGISRDEVQVAISRMNNGKATGMDGILVEVWKCLEKEGIDMLWYLI